ncbi:MAG: ATP-dependent RecD-like DNA helicase [Clostridiales bacterium]|nr:ATP-dependent RecD-like DNA helicase [Clostridiales bacterium]
MDGVAEKQLVMLTGTVENIIFNNEENGYTVFDMSVDEVSGGDELGDDIVTACGVVPNTNAGERIRVSGEWSFSKNYGRQFKVAYYEKQLPATSNEILRYLSSRAVKGIGPKTAKKLVDQYGEDTFDVIENHPEWIAQLPGISSSKAQEISESFREQFGVRTLMMFCREYFSAAVSMKIYKKWGGSSVDVIKSNPYRLCEEFSGIGFDRADRFAQSLGVGVDSEFRLMSGIRYILNESARSGGHSFLPYGKLIAAAAASLGVETGKIDAAAEKMLGEGRLTRAQIENLDAVYDSRAWRCEKEISEKLHLLDKLCAQINAGDVERFIQRIELEEDKQYASMQRKAIVDAVNSGVMLLTGGPGTGKTTVIRAVIRIFKSLDMKIALAAPTGRAAKRMSEATQCEAKTIHRLLEMEFADDERDNFKKNENDLLEEDVIIIDEASMIDMYLMNSLLKAIKPGARLMLIGDSDQLPSVGAGNVLNDIIASGAFCTVKLTEIFRQARESMIITNAHKINDGEYPTLNAKTGDFFFLPRNSDADVAATIVDLCRSRLPRKYGEDVIEGIQVISPSRKGVAGTETLNHMLQDALNPQSNYKREKKYRETIFREGDRVMQIKNDYDIQWERDGKEGMGVFNGDIGVIETINVPAEQMIINFDERVVTYEFAKLEELDHAYAITVHKSQGSEYPIVIMPMYSSCPKQLLSRNLLYTAVTRAQKMVILVGDPYIVCEMVDNNRQIMRYTGLLRHD